MERAGWHGDEFVCGITPEVSVHFGKENSGIIWKSVWTNGKPGPIEDPTELEAFLFRRLLDEHDKLLSNQNLFWKIIDMAKTVVSKSGAQ
jgi:hypothetical protein